MKKGTAGGMDAKEPLCVNVHSAKVTVEGLSRFGILDWVKDSLHIKYKKVEQFCSGAAYYQFMDMLFPGCVNLRKVKFETNLEYDYIQNLKLLLAYFHKVGVDKDIPVDSLIKGRFQDNLQFAQWFKQFFDANCDRRVYNPVEARRDAPVGGTRPGPSRIANNGQMASRLLHAAKSMTRNSPVSKPLGVATRIPDGAGAGDSHRLEDLTAQVAGLKSTVDELKMVIDLIHGKLRKFEVFCQGCEETNEKPEVVQQILKIVNDTEEGSSVPKDYVKGGGVRAVGNGDEEEY